MVKCPACENIELEDLGYSGTTIYKKYSKTDEYNATYSDRPYQAKRYLCLSCGLIHERLDDDKLKKYKEDSEYFIK